MTYPIILDCDPGEDDALAILLAFAENLPVNALVCGFGNTSVENTFRNGAGLLTLAGRQDVPLFKGAEKPFLLHPLQAENVSAGDFVGKNGLCGIELSVSSDLTIKTNEEPEEDRLAALAQHIRDTGPLTYIVTGPCSTLAHMLSLLGDSTKEFIRNIILMGGALDAAGNTGPLNPLTGKPYAEFNFFCDPHAASVVLNSGIPVTLVPWDLTETIVLNYEELAPLIGINPSGDFVLNLIRSFLESYGIAHERSFEFNDCITLIAYKGQGLLKPERVRLLTAGEESGRLVRDNASLHEIMMFDLPPEERQKIRDSILERIGVIKK